MKNYLKIIASFLTIFVLCFTSCSEDIRTDTENKAIKIEKVKKVASELKADIKFDDTVNKDNAIVFNTEKEFKAFIVKMQNETRNNQITVVDDVNIDGIQARRCTKCIYHVSGMSTGFATLNFDISVSGGCISGISGAFTGITAGVGYSQGEEVLGCNSGVVCGIVNYNLIFEGIGAVYSQEVCYKITLR